MQAARRQGTFGTFNTALLLVIRERTYMMSMSPVVMMDLMVEIIIIMKATHTRIPSKLTESVSIIHKSARQRNLSCQVLNFTGSTVNWLKNVFDHGR
jgi:hypothetical protein